MIMDGAFVGRSEGAAYVQTVAAGVDLLLYPRQPRAARDALLHGLETGVLPPERVRKSLERYESLLARASHGPAAPADGHDLGMALADRLVARGLSKPAPALKEPLDLVVIDDDIGGPFPASPSDWTAPALEEGGVARGGGGPRVAAG